MKYQVTFCCHVNIAVRAARYIVWASPSRCTCVQSSPGRACDVGREWTHLISRGPDDDPPITLVLNQCAEADQPQLLVENKKKMSNEQENITQTKTWCQKEKRRQSSGIISARGRMILSKHVFVVRRYHTTESCTGLILKTRPHTPYLKPHQTRFSTVAQITFRTTRDKLLPMPGPH